MWSVGVQNEHRISNLSMVFLARLALSNACGFVIKLAVPSFDLDSVFGVWCYYIGFRLSVCVRDYLVMLKYRV